MCSRGYAKKIRLEMTDLVLSKQNTSISLPAGGADLEIPRRCEIGQVPMPPNDYGGRQDDRSCPSPSADAGRRFKAGHSGARLTRNFTFITINDINAHVVTWHA